MLLLNRMREAKAGANTGVPVQRAGVSQRDAAPTVAAVEPGADASDVDQLVLPAQGGGTAPRKDRGILSVETCRSILHDPRLLDLDPDALGIAVMIQAHERAGRPIPANPRAAGKRLGVAPARIARILGELEACDPPLIVHKGIYLSGAPFGPPTEPEVSEVKSQAAKTRWAKASRPATPATTDTPSKKAPATPCPYGEIRTLFNRHCPSLCPINDTDLWTPARKTNTNRRWQEKPDLAFWEAYFIKVEARDFLAGRVKDARWKASYDWIMEPSHIARIEEGEYANVGRRSLFGQGAFTRAGDYGQTDAGEIASFLSDEEPDEQVAALTRAAPPVRTPAWFLEAAAQTIARRDSATDATTAAEDNPAQSQAAPSARSAQGFRSTRG